MNQKISDEEAAKIIEDEMPGFELVERRPSDERMSDKKPEATAPDVQVWQRKQSDISERSERSTSLNRSMETVTSPDASDEDDLYELFLQKKRPDDADYSDNAENARAEEGENQPQSKIVVVQRKDASRNRRDGASEPKGVVIDGKTRKVIGYQG
jgi:hypothetical protein